MIGNSTPWPDTCHGSRPSSDTLPLKVSDKDTWGLIVNLDPVDLPRSHWIALWQATPHDPIEWMDSLNLPLERHRTMDIYQWVSQRSPCGDFERNTRALQAFNSKACGMYCIFCGRACKAIRANNSWDRIRLSISSKMTRKSDDGLQFMSNVSLNRIETCIGVSSL